MSSEDSTWLWCKRRDLVRYDVGRAAGGVGTRFTTSAFMRAKLGDQLEQRGVAPHIYESEDEAKGAVRETLARTE
jgi:hypothetical protein